MKYTITYSGWETVEVEAQSEQAAEDKFWEDGLNHLFDTEIHDVKKADDGE